MTDVALLRLGKEPDRWAVFLDIDGTLLDLAATPDAIEVPLSLPRDLERLSRKLNGALALVTGRAVQYADALFRPFQFPIAGLHGAEMRGTGGRLLEADASPHFEEIKRVLAEEALQWDGVLIEDKGAAVAAHYRLAPQYETVLEARMQHFAAQAGPGWALQLGKMVFEIRPSRASKGDAVERFLQQTSFKGRLPLTIGDDLTDESMFSVANALGGHSIRVGTGEHQTFALSTATSPSYVRSMINRLTA